MQDKITAELLKSAGMEQKKVQRFATRVRPKLKDLKPIELYGDAVVETDEAKKRQLLVAALDADPSFTYAARDLDALEARLKEYDKTARAAQDKEIRELQNEIGNEKDPQAYMKAMTLMGKLTAQMRWKTLKLCAKSLENSKIQPPPGSAITVPELASFYLLMCYMNEKNDDALLHDGEKFLAKYPASMYSVSVRTWLDQAIERKRQAFEGEQEVVKAVNDMEPQKRADLCQVGMVYNEHHQYKEARRLLDQCLQSGKSVFPRPVIYQLLIVMSSQLGDYAAGRRYLEQLQREDPKSYNSMKGMTAGWPKD
jgi:tetratricopeptide (TPR) repeat protein